ncbi:MAG: patatin-like protein [Acidobacteria bacterium]|nr:patatin-like protein [Acidobacteriota bacterium]
MAGSMDRTATPLRGDDTPGPVGPASPPDVEADQELRLAVVLYGGVSLAVYIHGVTRELYHLVRATAPADPGAVPGPALLGDGDLRGSEVVYRRIGRLLGPGTGIPAAAADPGPGAPIRTRFVVDVLSGTSAGGINAVLLAKALAGGLDYTTVARRWLELGDLAGLLNDREGARGLPRRLRPRRRPASLLDGRRMYHFLLKALREMPPGPGTTPGDPRSPYLDELDLYVTATDLRGLPLPLRLSDGDVLERRHRAVFRFIYAGARTTGDERNDFTAAFDPFLAFAARCTSAFPVAFEPATLADADDVVPARGSGLSAESVSADPRWEPFTRDYLCSGAMDGAPFARRAFGDGGCLDNKPFGPVVETLARRHADVPVRRKLVFVEPSPDPAPEGPESAERPDAAENLVAALLTLPRTETIREDIEAIGRRNRLIGRTRKILGRIQKDVRRDIRDDGPAHEGMDALDPGSADAWVDRDLDDMIARRGVSYGAYHWFRVSRLTDEFATLVCRLSGIEAETARWEAVRERIRSWRDTRYADRTGDPRSRPTQNRFLLDFDLGFRLRRLDFLRGKLDALFPLEGPEREILTCAGVDAWPSEAEKEAFRGELRALKARVNRVHDGLRAAGRRLRARGADNDLLRPARALALSMEDPGPVPSGPAPGEAGRLALETFAGMVRDRLATAFREASAAMRDLLGPRGPEGPGAGLVDALRHYYNHFDSYDMITLPYLFGTDLGETAPVDTLRVSPVDATGVVDERLSRVAKLKGLGLMHFGAFLDPYWRKSDLLWGRLDGAERLVTALVPPSGEREALVREAQAAILREELAAFDPGEQAEFRQFCLGAAAVAGPDRLAAVEALFGRALPGPPPPGPTETIRPDPEKTLRSAARAALVTGKMLSGLARKYETGNRAAEGFTRAARFFWGFVEVSAPGTLPRLIFRHWLKVLYLSAFLVYAAGLLLGVPGASRVGLACLGATAAAHFAAFLLGRFMRCRGRPLRVWLLRLVRLALAILAGLGVVKLVEWAVQGHAWLAGWLGRIAP